MQADIESALEQAKKSESEIEHLQKLALKWNSSLSDEDHRAFRDYLEKCLKETDDTGLLRICALSYYCKYKDYDKALETLEKVDDDYVENLYGEPCKELTKLQILTSKALEEGDTASCRAYAKEGLDMMRDFIDKNKDDIDKELDRQGDNINYGVKPALNIMQYCILLYIVDESKFETYKDELLRRHPQFEQCLSGVPDFAGPYVFSTYGF